MKIEKEAVCGNIESGDIQVTLSPNEEEGIVIELTSVVKPIFGEAIEETVREVLADFGIDTARVVLQDKGALDCVIRARVQAAVLRSLGQKYDWSKEDALWQAV